MSGKSSFARKIVAALLALVLLVSLLPLSVSTVAASDDTEPPVSGTTEPVEVGTEEPEPTTAPATEEPGEETIPPETTVEPEGDTPEETTAPPEATEEPEAPVEPDILIEGTFFNDEAKKYVDEDNDLTYIDGETLNKITINFIPASEVMDALIGETDSLSIFLQKGEDDATDITDNCAISFYDGGVSIELEPKELFEDKKIPAAAYKLYVQNSEKTELASTEFIIPELPKTENVAYKGAYNDFGVNSVTVSFEVNCPILKEVKVDGVAVSKSDGKYSFEAAEAKNYTISISDELERTVTETIKKENIKLDQDAPTFSNTVFTEAEGEKTTLMSGKVKPEGEEQEYDCNEWTNQSVEVTVEISDGEGCGVKEDTVSVKAPDGKDVTSAYKDGKLTFVADTAGKYTMSCKDNLENSGTYEIIVQIDKTAPQREDFTLSFQSAETEVDKILSFLTFGIYCNSDIKVSLDVNDAKGAPISEKALYNGENKLEPTAEGDYLLKAPEEGAVSFDLNAEAADKAGNKAKYNLKDDELGTKILDIDKDTFQQFDKGLFEIVLSNLVPQFGNVSLDFTQKQSVGDPLVTHVAGDGTISVTVKEESTGLDSVYAVLKAEGAESGSALAEKAFNQKATADEATMTENLLSQESAGDEVGKEKETEHTISFNLAEFAELTNSKVEELGGMYTVEFFAAANNKKKNNISASFFVDNAAPALSEPGFQFDKDWTKDDVTVSFALTDSTGIDSVVCKDKSGKTITVNKTEAGYTFVVEENGTYTVTATDTLGNSVSYDSVAVENIDKTAPHVKGNVDYTDKWAKSIEVKFTAEDLPAGAACGLGENPVVVKYYVDDSENQQTLDKKYVSFNPANGECTFTAQEYGHYSVVLTDAKGNESGEIEVGELKVDHIAPTINEVAFSMADISEDSTATMNQKPYGTFANAKLKMTVSVTNNKADGEKCSPLEDDAVKASYPENAVGGFISAQKPNEDKSEYVFLIDTNDSLTAEALKTMKLSVEDTASNKHDYVLGSDCHITLNDDGMSESLYEVIVSTLNPDIPDFTYTKDKNGNKDKDSNLFNGKTVTVESEVSDKIIGLDKIKVECGTIPLSAGTEEATLKSVALTDVTADAVTLDSSTEKKTSAKVSYKVNTENSARYVFRITATNNTGNTLVKAEYFDVDNTAPEITDIEIHGDVKNSGANGIYLNGNTKPYIRVYARDTDGTIPASGVAAIELSGIQGSGLKSAADGKSYVDFNLEASAKYENITVKATDAFGTVNEIKLVDFAKGITGDATVTPDKNNFEIVVNNESDMLKKAKDFTFDFDYKDGDSGLKDNIKVYKYVENGTISFTIENTLSGIKEAVVTLNDVALSASEDGKLTLKEKTDDYTKVTQKAYAYNAIGDDTGKYVLSVAVTDYCGVTNTFSVTYYIDVTAPELVDVTFAPGDPSALDQFFNIITFGLYSRDNVNVTVKVADNGYSAGIRKEDIKLTTGEAGNVIEGDIKEIESSAEKRVYTKTYTFAQGEGDKSFFNGIKVQLQDAFENKAESDAVDYNKIKVPLSKDGETESFFKDPFDIVVSKQTPIISNLITTGENEYTNGNKVWYSAPPVVTFDVTDNISKLHSVKVTLNDEDITEYCNIEGAKSFPKRPGVFTDFTNHDAANDENISAVSVTLDTNNENLTLFEDGQNNGEGNTIEVTATGNNGVSVKQSIKFYLDKTKPYITGFTFSEGNIDGDLTVLDKNTVTETYGYYFENTTTVTVTASDGSGSGVRRIGFITKDINNTEKVYEEVTASTNADFVVPANFKGTIFAYAVDNVENNKDKEDKYSPDNVIVETQAQHDRFSEISITAPPTPFLVDNSSLSAEDRNLYDADTVTLSVETASTYAGIRNVHIDVTAPYDTGKNQSYDVKVNNNRGIDNSDWAELTNDSNLVTKMRGVVRVSNNSNDIKITVTLTDRAGLSSKKERIIHIDKVNPTVDIKYDLNNPAKVGGEDFYKETRTATITVTERNFDENAVRATITTNHGTNPPALSAWTHNMNSENPDLSTHVATVVFSADEDYTLGFECTDRAGRKSNTWGPDKFTVDKTAPEISVSFDVTTSYEPYHNVTRVATITIHEHNFYEPYVQINQTATGADNTTAATPPAVVGWSTSGDTSTATITFDDDGKYSFTVDFKDKADNQARQAVVDTFYIDKHIDKPVISGVKDSHAYAGEIAPEIRYFDYNYDKSEYVLTRYDLEKSGKTVTDLAVSDGAGERDNRVVSYADFEKITENDGIYRLEATMQDRAGNKSSDQVLFSVNRFGSTFMLADDPSEILVHEQFYTNDAPDIAVKEINVTEIKKSDIQISRDGSASTLTYGTDYETTVDGSQNQWYTLVYKIFKKNFEAEGKYDITISATDGFDKTVTNRTAYKESGNGENKIDRTCPVSFVVDKTAPIITVSGIDNNEYYEEAVKEVAVICEDPNITADNLKVTFDNKTLDIADYEMTENAGAIELKLKLEADGNTEDRQFSVSITDKANNPSESEVNPFRLSASWLARLLHYHLPLVIIIGSVVLLGIAFAVFMAVRKNKKNNDK